MKLKETGLRDLNELNVTYDLGVSPRKRHVTNYRPISGETLDVPPMTDSSISRARRNMFSTVETMMAAEVRWLLIFLISCVASLCHGETLHRKFEYKYSFKPPYLAQKDGSVPFWEYGGSEYNHVGCIT